MIYLLVWLLVGSLGVNIMWILNYKSVMDDFYLWKEEKTSKYSNYHYLKGLLFGLLLGPFVLILITKRILRR